ncbi:origin recognition complex subunit 3 N-terminus-domain-containing protein [Xylaria bambusicola]|uniref:origin recognition complex subunit 3 N-terminus-domain-containing protein n=1 Tax=Xylaria bambusicola TaxID=326684 RepID=UPI002007FE3B|nr:origin recognition complex subunit 3 N-terminus-domain-containing protein [Xylaria bambusicola]KAI0508385.1 origin recognition complex subunit 3 N-terminus-domain-containing protein [Xylaria bambusicola]
MDSPVRSAEDYEDKQHKAAYIFDPLGDTDDTARPAKRRRVSKKTYTSESSDNEIPNSFQHLLGGAESKSAVDLREQTFEELWSVIQSRIHGILRETNQSTLRDVLRFLQNAPDYTPAGKIPSAFIITGPNIASVDLLFEQLSETLQHEADAYTVRLRSGDASNLRAVLRKIIHDVVSKGSVAEDELISTTGKDGRKFLNYDLEGLYSHLKLTPQRSLVVIAFQDSEAFDSGLLSDLISLLISWLDRIPFAFLFGIATSVELFEARLLKSTCQSLYGDQFDVEQTASIIDKIFKTAIAHSQTKILLGPGFLSSLLERQREQVASIPDFIKSLKYAYMCHFYSNPLSFLVPDGLNSGALQPDHIELLQCLPSFQRAVEAAVKNNNIAQARILLEDKTGLVEYLVDCLRQRDQWITRLLRVLIILSTSKAITASFADLYMDISYNGLGISNQYGQFFDSIKRMEPCDSEGYLSGLLDTVQHGDESLGLNPWIDDTPANFALLSEILAGIKQLRIDASEKGHVLRSRYSRQGKILRTTVVAQKVQLSQDTATLTDHDKSYTDLIHRLLEYLEATLRLDGAPDIPFNEVWLYDSKAPYKDVFIPRPRNVLERALSRPHDYLGCSCCKTSMNQITCTLPTTAILYQLYLETGSLVNAADLWSAYYAVVGEDTEEGLDEQTALLLFYRALAELKAMGFVKQSRKKADHVAKLAWKGL